MHLQIHMHYVVLMHKMHLEILVFFFWASGRYFCTVDQCFYHVTCSIPYLHVQDWNLGTVNTCFLLTGSIQAGLFNIGFIWHCVINMEYIEFFILLQVIQEGYAGQSGLKGEKGDRVRNVKHSIVPNEYVCVLNPTLCLGLLGINDCSAVYFGILYKCLIRS